MPVDVRHTHISYYFYFIPTKKAAKPIKPMAQINRGRKKNILFSIIL